MLKRFANWRWSTRGTLVLVTAMLIGAGTVMAQLGGAPRPANATDIALQRGLVGWWKYDGNFKDATPGSHNDAFSTAGTFGTDRKGVSGKASSMNGTTEFGTVSNFDYNVMMPGKETSSWTMSVWAKANGSNNDETLLVGRNGCHGGIYTWSGGYAFAIKTSACWTNAQSINYTPSVMTNWHLLTGVYANGAMTFYCDGVSVGTATFAASFAGYASTLQLGGTGSAGWFYNGNMDDARVYNRALSAGEVAALYGSYDSGLKAAAGEKGMVSWFKMNGNTKDSSPYGRDGTNNGAALTTDRKNTANSAYSFNGSSSYISNSGYSELGTNNQPYAFSGWFMANNLTGNIIHMASFSNGLGWCLPPVTLNAGKLTANSWNGGAVIAQGTTVVSTGTWHHFAVTWDASGGLKAYLDGVNEATTAMGSYGASGATNYLFLGYLDGGGCSGRQGWFNGKLDDVRVYNRSLTQAEITAQYQAYNSQVSLSTLQQGLVGDWPMNGNLKDATPYSNNGTIWGNVLATTDRKSRASSAYVMDGANGEAIGISSSGKYTQFGTSSFSVASWIKTSSGLSQRCIMSTAGGALGWRFGFDNGRPYFLVGDGTNYQEGTIGSTTLNDNNWHHLAIVYTHGANWSVTAYIDGTNVGTVALPGSITGSINDSFVEIGSMNGGNNGVVTGSIDDLRVYNRPLSGTEVAALAQFYR